MSRSKNAGLAGRAYDLLAEHGPLTSYELAERLGVAAVTAASACGHLVRLDQIHPQKDAAFRPIGAHGRRCHRWAINPHPQGGRDTACRVDWETGITEEDRAWMRHYRERHERRLALAGRA